MKYKIKKQGCHCGSLSFTEYQDDLWDRIINAMMKNSPREGYEHYAPQLEYIWCVDRVSAECLAEVLRSIGFDSADASTLR